MFVFPDFTIMMGFALDVTPTQVKFGMVLPVFTFVALTRSTPLPKNNATVSQASVEQLLLAKCASSLLSFSDNTASSAQ